MPKRRRAKPVVEESSDDEMDLLGSPARGISSILCEDSDHGEREDLSPDEDVVVDTPESDEEWLMGPSDQENEEEMNQNLSQRRNDASSLDDITASFATTSTQDPATQRPWTWSTEEDFIPAEPFDEGEAGSGWNVPLDPSMSDFDIFQLLFPAEIMDFITAETNKYAEQIILNTRSQSRRQKKFVPITNREMMRYFAIRILMGIDRKPAMEHYWSRDSLLGSSMIPKIMTSDRFFEIHRYLHFCDNNLQKPGDHLHKIRDLWAMVMKIFTETLSPYQNLCVDESLIKFKGRLSWKQFITTKRSRFGIKIFSLVDSLTGFILFSIIYAGKGTNDLKFDTKVYGYGGAVVLDLMEPYFNKNHHTYVDNYFNSSPLAKKLLEEKTYICGTLRANRKNVPKVPKMKKGDLMVRYSESPVEGILFEAWKDKRVVRMLSTGTSHAMLSTAKKGGGFRDKPLSVLEYNKSAGGVDKADMLIHLYDCNRRCKKWYKKMGLALFEMALRNGLVMRRTMDNKYTFLNFRLNVVRGILAITGGTSTVVNLNVDAPLRLTGRHFLKKLPTVDSTKDLFSSHQSKRRCHYCSEVHKKQSRTVYWCQECNTPLCAVPCFELFHTKASI